MNANGREMYRPRTTDEARAALSAFCAGVGTHGDKHVHIFSIPVDQERDADMVLSDVIVERDILKARLARLERVVEAARMHNCLSPFQGGVCDLCASLSALDEGEVGK